MQFEISRQVKDSRVAEALFVDIWDSLLDCTPTGQNRSMLTLREEDKTNLLN